jgi:hypothetical protein
MKNKKSIGEWALIQKFRLFIDKFLSLFEKRPILLMTIISISGIVTIGFNMNQLTSRIIETMAKGNAALYSDTLKAFRTLYTREVVERLRSEGVEVTHDYQEKEGAVPLPATFTMILGKEVGNLPSGGKTRLYSEYPFPWTKDGGPRDDFEKKALHFLKKNSEKTFISIEKYGGRQSIRYATADIMRPSCVHCHNTHPQTPKNDWKKGDVRGILEVIHPLDNFIIETRAGLKQTFLLMGTITCSGLALLFLLTDRLRKRRMELEDALRLTEEEHIKTESALKDAEASRTETEKALKQNEENRKELERTNKFMVGRELKMVELKKENKSLKTSLGK